ncbi:MAG: long-chain fatty acid--CoA ligase [Bacteroidetes bacterium]|jgi:long-chain acyl-CoA synthetase|nr:long-chain fatty acid--CoA ligase [Bacteroidota bacterium]
MIAENFIKLYERSFKDNWELPALTDYAEKRTLTYGDFAKEIAFIHTIFSKYNIKKGDKIALVGKNNSHWCSVYLASVSYGAVIVPILQDFHIDNIVHIINHSESVMLFTHEQIWENIEDTQISNVLGVYSLTNMHCIHQQKNESPNRADQELNETFGKCYPDGFQKEHIRYAHVDNSEEVILSYTSGTTGFSKAVILTANNMIGNISSVRNLNLLFKGERMLALLPLAHAYGCAFDFLYSLSVGAHVTLLGKTPSPKVLLLALADVKPKLIICVPLIIEKIYKKQILPQISRRTTKLALSVPFLEQKVHAKIRQKLIDSLGGNFRQVIIGGAALNKDVEAFLYKIKFPFSVGYGMTECGPLVSFDLANAFVPTSCGRILKDVMDVRIDSEDPYRVLGEIQVKGENVMKGYYKNEEATKATFTEDGWLRTGDLGTLDKNKRIFIRGRSKSMILGPSGQNIFPEEIESKINNLPYIKESVVIQRNGKLVALVYPDFEAMDATGVSHRELSAIMAENKIALNESLANYENISGIQIYPNEFEKTPKKSIKRYLYEM